MLGKKFLRQKAPSIASATSPTLPSVTVKNDEEVKIFDRLNGEAVAEVS